MLTASLIMLTYNHLDLTKKALTSLRQHTKLTPEVRLTVIDNHSQDGTPKFLLGLDWCDVILNRHRAGISSSYNQGIRRLRAKYYVTLANDVTFCPHWLESLMWCAASGGDIGIVGPAEYKGDRVIIHHVKPNAYIEGRTVKVPPSKKVEVEYLQTACMLIKDELIRQIGLFDEAFDPFWYDDTDYCFRARDAGWKVIRYYAVPVRWLYEATTREHPDRAKIKARNQHRFYMKWRDKIR